MLNESKSVQPSKRNCMRLDSKFLLLTNVIRERLKQDVLTPHERAFYKRVLRVWSSVCLEVKRTFLSFHWTDDPKFRTLSEDEIAYYVFHSSMGLENRNILFLSCLVRDVFGRQSWTCVVSLSNVRHYVLEGLHEAVL